MTAEKAFVVYANQSILGRYVYGYEFLNTPRLPKHFR